MSRLRTGPGSGRCWRPVAFGAALLALFGESVVLAPAGQAGTVCSSTVQELQIWITQQDYEMPFPDQFTGTFQFPSGAAFLIADYDADAVSGDYPGTSTSSNYRKVGSETWVDVTVNLQIGQSPQQGYLNAVYCWV